MRDSREGGRWRSVEVWGAGKVVAGEFERSGDWGEVLVAW